MNHLYRLVWNHVACCWQAVAENVKGFGKGRQGRRRVQSPQSASPRFSIKPLLAGLSLISATALAGPQGGQVVAGSVTIQQTGAITTINQSSAKAAIDWSRFSVGKSESVRFNQPSASAITLNRVTGTESSQILGSISANGQVFILNPNGVLFGQGAQVNVGGLVASTGRISNADFMAGNYPLTGGTGSVVNQGNITVPEGGTIALIAPVVQNTGTLNAPQGNVLLAAADAVTLKLQDGSLIGYTLDQGSLQALVDNGGIIQAAGGHVVLTAKGLDALAKATINHSGIIEAQTVSSKSGVVELLGDMQTGEINLSGKIDASAPNGGDGGLVETSAALVNLKNGQHVTTMSSMGKTGTWLIDPYDWIIAASGGNATGTQISGMLENSNVSLRTAGVGINQINAHGDIIINDAISWNSGNTLTLDAERNVDINSQIRGAYLGVMAPGTLTISGTGSVTMRQINYQTNGLLLQGPSTATTNGIMIDTLSSTRDVRIESSKSFDALSILPSEMASFLHTSNDYGIHIGGQSLLTVSATLHASDLNAGYLNLGGSTVNINAPISFGTKQLSLQSGAGGTTINAPISSDTYIGFFLSDNGTVSQAANGKVSANTLMAQGAGNVLLHGASGRNKIQNVSADVTGTFWVTNDDTPLAVSNTPWNNGIHAYNIGLYTGSGLTLNAPVVATGSGDVSVGSLSVVDSLCSGPCIRPHIELGVGQYFTNNVGAGALTVPDGKFWSLIANSPSTTQLNGLVPGAVSYFTESINGDILLSANRVFYGNHDDTSDDDAPDNNPHTSLGEWMTGYDDAVASTYGAALGNKYAKLLDTARDLVVTTIEVAEGDALRVADDPLKLLDDLSDSKILAANRILGKVGTTVQIVGSAVVLSNILTDAANGQLSQGSALDIATNIMGYSPLKFLTIAGDVSELAARLTGHGSLSEDLENDLQIAQTISADFLKIANSIADQVANNLISIEEAERKFNEEKLSVEQELKGLRDNYRGVGLGIALFLTGNASDTDKVIGAIKSAQGSISELSFDIVRISSAAKVLRQG